MAKNYRAATCIYRVNQDFELFQEICNILKGLGVVVAGSSEDNTICEVVFGKDQIHNKIKFDTLVIVGATDGKEVYHILKHKSLFNSVERIFVNYSDEENCEQLYHRHWNEYKEVAQDNDNKVHLYCRQLLRACV